MKRLAAMTLLALVGCDGPHSESQLNQSITCPGGQTPIYTSRFSPGAGGSGVATGEDAANGKTASDPNAPVAAPDANETAMTATCGQANCANGQVAVDMPPMEPNNGGGGLGEGDTDGAPVPTTKGTPVDPPAQPTNAMDTIVCTDPPPVCPAGLSPQFTVKGTWECTDCTLVVTYGGTYGNFRRCVSLPHLTCGDGQVPTWVFEDEAWECKPTCNNGLYDQHVIGGELVCVPC